MNLSIISVFLSFLVTGCLTMPHTSNVGQFGVMMGCLLDMSTVKAGLDYNGYGCYCGFGGKGEPLDATDACCETHDDCYTAVQTSDMCRGYNQAYVIPYNYQTLNCGTYRAQVICSGAGSYEPDYKYTECAMAMCACDKAGSECFQQSRSTYNEEYKRYVKESC